MLRENGHEAFKASDNGPMHHHRPRSPRSKYLSTSIGRSFVRCRPLELGRNLSRHVFEFEILGKLEVELYRGTLPIPPQSVGYRDIDLRPIKRSVTLVQLPLAAPGSCEGVQCVFQLALCNIPRLDISQKLVGPGRQFQPEGETEEPIDAFEEVEKTLNLFRDLATHSVKQGDRNKVATYLVLSTEDVGVILLKLSDSRHSIQRSRGLISVQHTEIRHTKRELSVASFSMAEHDTVARAVHWFQCPLLLLHIEYKHVFGVMLPMP